jgi:hypothetical protein
MQYTMTNDIPDEGKPIPEITRSKMRPKQKYRNSDGTYSGYSGTKEGWMTIALKRIRLARNQGPSAHNRKKH